jgi:hypothetical protein
VLAYHGPTRSGMLAYYDGTILEQRHYIYHIARGSFGLGQAFFIYPHAGLPRWLLTSKAMLEEGMNQFRLYAHWNIWLLTSRIDTPKTREGTLMNPKNAKSISLKRMLTGYHEAAIGPINLDYVVGPNLTEPKVSWLNDIRNPLGKATTLKVLQISIGYPYLEGHHAKPIKKVDWPFPPCPSIFPQPLRQLIRACKALKTLEVELLHHVEVYVANKIPDTEYLALIQPEIIEDMGYDVWMTTKTTASPLYGDTGPLKNDRYLFPAEQLLDQKLVFTKNVKKQKT